MEPFFVMVGLGMDVSSWHDGTRLLVELKFNESRPSMGTNGLGGNLDKYYKET